MLFRRFSAGHRYSHPFRCRDLEVDHCRPAEKSAPDRPGSVAGGNRPVKNETKNLGFSGSDEMLVLPFFSHSMLLGIGETRF